MKPILFTLFEIPFYSYPIFLGLALSALIFYFINYSKEKIPLTFLIFTGVISFIGSKILFLLSVPNYLKSLIDMTSFYYGGGFVFYGGLIGFLLSTYLYHRVFSKKTVNWKAWTMAILLAHAIGRVGCYLSGCCHGIKITQSIFLPIQLIEAAYLFFIFIIFHFYLRRKNYQNNFYLFGYLFTYGIGRLVLERFRGDEIRGIYYNLSTSQWISIALIVISGFYLSINFDAKNQSR